MKHYRFEITLAILLLALAVLIWVSVGKLEKAETECAARGGVLAQTRAPPYVCVQPR